MLDSYARYLQDKRVIIVGPAPTLTGRAMGKQIDKYDVVVRLNRGSLLSQPAYKDHGRRTDVLYHSGFSGEGALRMLDKALTREVAWLSGALPKYGIWEEQIKKLADIAAKRNTGFHSIPYPIYQYGQIETKGRLNTGTAAILDILQMPVRSIHVVGVTMYSPDGAGAAYAEGIGYQGLKSEAVLGMIHRVGVHKVAPQMLFIRDLAKNNSILSLGDDVEDAISYWEKKGTQ